ncbi:MAG: hypothetical protein ATN33_00675 [Epulopiscium sp. Nele67-Bin001]|nr:MAG: hypothetical protein ATN33_00675 [Epulopiscium sp. Nele67-Bin001]
MTLFVTVQGTEETKKEPRLLPIYSVNTKTKQASLTFDVAWGDEDLQLILDILDANEVKATFFIVGDWAEQFPQHVKTIAEKGHDIANHSYKHPHVNKLTKEEVKEDIMKAHKVIKDLIDYDMDLYRAPYGEYNNTVVEAANECGYYIVQWDVDSLDWKEYGKQPLIDKVLKHKNLTFGSIILLHTGTDYTKEALDEIIKGLKVKGYELVPMSEMLIREEYKCDHTGRQYKK